MSVNNYEDTLQGLYNASTGSDPAVADRQYEQYRATIIGLE